MTAQHIHTKPSDLRSFAGLGGDLYGVADSRPPLVLLPGLTFDRGSWRPVLNELDQLDPARRVLCLDLPGHGQSADLPARRFDELVDTLRQAIDAAEVDAPILVGHSMSGGLASLYAAAHPARGVVNVDAPPDLGPFVQLLQSVAGQIRGPGLPRVWNMMVQSFHLELLPAVAQQTVRMTSHPDPDLIRSYWQELLDTTPEKIDAWVTDAMHRLSGFAIPYLLILGAEMPPAVRSRVGAAAPNATVEVWPGSGHFPHLAHPRRFAARLAASARWVSAVPPGAVPG